MDFDEIKKTWKNSFKDDELLNKEEIEAKLKIKSKSNIALGKVKRNYKLELIVGIGMSIYFIIWMLIYISDAYKLSLSLFTFLFFGTLISFTWRSYNKVRKTVISSDQLKPALIKTIKDVERYVNFNTSTFSKYLLLPFAICFGMFIGIFVSVGEEGMNAVMEILENRIIRIVIILVVLSVIFIPFSQYMTKKMYKQHLDELKQCLKEFEESED